MWQPRPIGIAEALDRLPFPDAPPFQIFDPPDAL
jgi:hypothetical protein